MSRALSLSLLLLVLVAYVFGGKRRNTTKAPFPPMTDLGVVFSKLNQEPVDSHVRTCAIPEPNPLIHLLWDMQCSDRMTACMQKACTQGQMRPFVHYLSTKSMLDGVELNTDAAAMEAYKSKINNALAEVVDHCSEAFVAEAIIQKKLVWAVRTAPEVKSTRLFEAFTSESISKVNLETDAAILFECLLYSPSTPMIKQLELEFPKLSAHVQEAILAKCIQFRDVQPNIIVVNNRFVLVFDKFTLDVHNAPLNRPFKHILLVWAASLADFNRDLKLWEILYTVGLGRKDVKLFLVLLSTYVETASEYAATFQSLMLVKPNLPSHSASTDYVNDDERDLIHSMVLNLSMDEIAPYSCLSYAVLCATIGHNAGIPAAMKTFMLHSKEPLVLNHLPYVWKLGMSELFYDPAVVARFASLKWLSLVASSGKKVTPKLDIGFIKRVLDSVHAAINAPKDSTTQTQ